MPGSIITEAGGDALLTFSDTRFQITLQKGFLVCVPTERIRWDRGSKIFTTLYSLKPLLGLSGSLAFTVHHNVTLSILQLLTASVSPVVFNQGSFVSRGHLTKCGCHSWVGSATGIWRVEARSAVPRPATHRTVPTHRFTCQ